MGPWGPLGPWSPLADGPTGPWAHRAHGPHQFLLPENAPRRGEHPVQNLHVIDVCIVFIVCHEK